MGGEIEGDRETLLPGCKIATIEGVRILGGGEAGILPDGPRLRDIHGGVGTTQIGRDAGEGVEEVEVLDVVGPIEGLHRDAFRREPGSGGRRRLRHRGREIDAGEVRDAGHDAIRQLCHLKLAIRLGTRGTPPPQRLPSSRRSIGAPSHGGHISCRAVSVAREASHVRHVHADRSPPHHSTCRPSRWMRSRNLT
jgi:hypothetical protein